MTSRDREEHATVMSGLAVQMARLDRQQQELLDQIDAAHDKRLIHSLIDQVVAVKNRIQSIGKDKQYEDVVFAKKLLQAEIQTPAPTNARRLPAPTFPRPPPTDEGRSVDEKFVIDLSADDDEPLQDTEERPLQGAGEGLVRVAGLKRERSGSPETEELAVLRDHFPLQATPYTHPTQSYAAAEFVPSAAESAQRDVVPLQRGQSSASTQLFEAVEYAPTHHATAILPAQRTQQPTPTPSINQVRDHRYGKHAATIAASHPTVVPAPDGNGAFELRCDLCGGNCHPGSSGRGMYHGARGFMAHLSLVHRSYLRENECFTLESIVRRCAVFHLPPELVERIQAGDAGAYPVGIFPGAAKDVASARGKAKDRDTRTCDMRPAPFVSNPWQRCPDVPIDENREEVPGLPPAVWGATRSGTGGAERS